MSSADLVLATENALRELILSLLGDVADDEWVVKGGVRPDQVTKWKDMQAKEGKRRDAVLEKRLLHFSDLSDLGTILRKNWEVFEPVLGKRNAFDVDLGRLQTARNTLAHGRELLPHEEADVRGISGRIRNAVTIYRATSGAAGREYHPRLEDVHDSYGNAPSADQKMVFTEMYLRPGDSVEFSARGWDPDDKPFELQWRQLRDRNPRAFSSTFVWDVTEADIGEYARVIVELVSSRPYHRMGERDDYVEFLYHVIPND